MGLIGAWLNSLYFGMPLVLKEIVDSLDGYELSTDAGDLTATIRAPIAAARIGVFAKTEVGDIVLDVHLILDEFDNREQDVGAVDVCTGPGDQ